MKGNSLSGKGEIMDNIIYVILVLTVLNTVAVCAIIIELGNLGNDFDSFSLFSKIHNEVVDCREEIIRKGVSTNLNTLSDLLDIQKETLELLQGNVPESDDKSVSKT
jgi:hypothetical protein